MNLEDNLVLSFCLLWKSKYSRSLFLFTRARVCFVEAFNSLRLHRRAATHIPAPAARRNPPPCLSQASACLRHTELWSSQYTGGINRRPKPDRQNLIRYHHAGRIMEEHQLSQAAGPCEKCVIRNRECRACHGVKRRCLTDPRVLLAESAVVIVR
ncbi:hypothetical protein BKA80DRAFT_285745 [Phyllosticta citrichinensis]